MTDKNPDEASSEEIVSLLAQDHRKIGDLLGHFHPVRCSGDCNAMQLLAEVLCTELAIHVQLEREILYPALRRLPDTQKFLDEAEADHRAMHGLISELEFMDPEDERYDAEFSALCDHVARHIQAEENRLFPRIRQTALENPVVAALKSRRDQLRSEFGMPDERREGVDPAIAS